MWLLSLELWGCIRDLLLFQKFQVRSQAVRDATSEKVASPTMGGGAAGVELVNSKSWFAKRDRASLASCDPLPASSGPLGLEGPQPASLLHPLGHMTLERPGCPQMSVAEKLTFRLQCFSSFLLFYELSSGTIFHGKVWSSQTCAPNQIYEPSDLLTLG